MKSDIACNVVRDLLPNYIEKLTSEDTNRAIEVHFATCEVCSNEYEQMTKDIVSSAKVPMIELRFLKKVRRTKKIAAAICVVLTLVLSYLLYASEYHYTLDKGDLSSAITEFIYPSHLSQILPPCEAYVLETKSVGGTLIASYKDLINKDNYGVAVFKKGWNNQYRIIASQSETSEYSSVVQFYRIEISNKRYYVVNGYNLASDVGFYGLDFADYIDMDNQAIKTLRFAVKNPQFLDIYLAEDIDEQAVGERTDESYRYLIRSTSLYDTSGIEITEKYKNESVSTPVDSGAGKAELFMLYVYIAIIMVFGVVLTRYFLTE